MKSFILIAMACLVSAASADATCDECLTFAGNLEAYLDGEESIGNQVEFLVPGCVNADDPAGCEKGVRTWWPQMAHAMYPVFLEANAVCNELGACEVKSIVGEPTCDDCTNGVNGVAETLGSEELIIDAIEFLKGDAFCVTTPDAAACGAYVDLVMPYAMPALAGLLSDSAMDLCCEISSTGLCC